MLVLSVGHSEAIAAPSTASVAPAETALQDRGPTLVVEVDPATLDAGALRARVLEAGKTALAEQADPLGPDDGIRLRVEGQTFDYRIVVELRRHGVALVEQPAPSGCQCSSSELLLAVKTAVEGAAARLVEAAQAEARAAQEAADEETREPAGPDDPQSIPRQRQSDRLWVAGVVLTSVGAATGIAGLTMVVLDPQPVGAVSYVARDWQPMGYALLGTGVAVLAGGVTMIVVDRVRCRRRGRCRGAIARAGGVSWAGR